MRCTLLLVLLSACAVAADDSSDDSTSAPDAHAHYGQPDTGQPWDSSSYASDTGTGDDDGSAPEMDSGSSDANMSTPDVWAQDSGGGCNACPINTVCCNNIKSINYGKCILKACLGCCQ